MRIGILALRQSCDYLQIGGAESVVRRLALGLAKIGHTVDYVLYGGDSASRTLKVNSQISVFYHKTFDEALSTLGKHYDHVFTVYLPLRDRLRYARFQLSQRDTSFHKLALGTPKSLKHWAAFIIEVLLTTRKGLVFTTSTVTKKVLSYLGEKAIFFLPPVPEHYFKNVSNKQKTNCKLSLTFLGRLAPEKGWKEACEVFQRVQRFNKIQTFALGYCASEQQDGLVLEEWHNGTVIRHELMSRLNYEPLAEERIREILHRTDILLLPYQSMNGTIDPPLLLLEAMAAGCAIITRPIGRVEGVYGSDTPFMLRDGGYVKKTTALIESICNNLTILAAESCRVHKRATDLHFESSLVTSKLVYSLIR
jgi:glycosyltransferase involved in cell wall biosynthesis